MGWPFRDLFVTLTSWVVWCFYPEDKVARSSKMQLSLNKPTGSCILQDKIQNPQTVSFTRFPDYWRFRDNWAKKELEVSTRACRWAYLLSRIILFSVDSNIYPVKYKYLESYVQARSELFGSCALFMLKMRHWSIVMFVIFVRFEFHFEYFTMC